jgi:hypothetical protein
MTSPVSGATLAGASQTFSWNNSGASLYQVWVGSTTGGTDIGFSPQTTATTASITGLPTNGSTIYVRLWSQIGATWSFNDYTYTTANQVVSAIMTSPVNGSTLAGASQTFSWNNSGASLYQVWVGTTTGAFDIGFSPQTAITTATITGIPTIGSTIHVRLYSLNGATWTFNDYTYTASGTPVAATMVSPANGSPLAGSIQTFTWTNSGDSMYQVWVGSTVGASDLGFSPQTSGTTATIAGLPATGTVYVRLWSLNGSTWSFNDYTYTATAGGLSPAAMITPVNGSTVSVANASFTWNNAGATTYQVWVGTSVGTANLGFSPQTSGTTATITGLPASGTLYVRLWSLFGTSWTSNDYTYTATP